MIADFGLSKIIDKDKFDLLTTTCGTPGYMVLFLTFFTHFLQPHRFISWNLHYFYLVLFNILFVQNDGNFTLLVLFLSFVLFFFPSFFNWLEKWMNRRQKYFKSQDMGNRWICGRLAWSRSSCWVDIRPLIDRILSMRCMRSSSLSTPMSLQRHGMGSVIPVTCWLHFLFVVVVILCKSEQNANNWHDFCELSLWMIARGFVRALLIANPKDRMTAVQALNHPWLAQYHQQPMPHIGAVAMDHYSQHYQYSPHQQQYQVQQQQPAYQQTQRPLPPLSTPGHLYSTEVSSTTTANNHNEDESMDMDGVESTLGALPQHDLLPNMRVRMQARQRFRNAIQAVKAVNKFRGAQDGLLQRPQPEDVSHVLASPPR